MEKNKSFSLTDIVPAGRVNRHSLRASYFSPPPLPFHHCHSSPKAHTRGALAGRVHMTNYCWAYYQKSALAGGSVWGKEVGRRREERRRSKQSLLRIRRQRRRGAGGAGRISPIQNYNQLKMAADAEGAKWTRPKLFWFFCFTDTQQWRDLKTRPSLQAVAECDYLFYIIIAWMKLRLRPLHIIAKEHGAASGRPFCLLRRSRRLPSLSTPLSKRTSCCCAACSLLPPFGKKPLCPRCLHAPSAAAD